MLTVPECAVYAFRHCRAMIKRLAHTSSAVSVVGCAVSSSIDRVSIKFLAEILSLPFRSHDLLIFIFLDRSNFSLWLRVP